MKFQNCIFINFERTHRLMDGRTDRQAESNICPFNFSKVGGITIEIRYTAMIHKLAKFKML